MKRADDDKREMIKRIPSSFTSSAVLNAEYLVLGAGERMAMTVLPKSSDDDAFNFQQMAKSEHTEGEPAPAPELEKSPSDRNTEAIEATETTDTDNDQKKTVEKTAEKDTPKETSSEKKGEKREKKARKKAKKKKKKATREHKYRKANKPKHRHVPDTPTTTTKTTKTPTTASSKIVVNVQSEAVEDCSNPRSTILLPSAVFSVAEENSQKTKGPPPLAPPREKETSVSLTAKPKKAKKQSRRHKLKQQHQQQKDTEGDEANVEGEKEESNKEGRVQQTQKVPPQHKEQKRKSPRTPKTPKTPKYAGDDSSSTAKGGSNGDACNEHTEVTRPQDQNRSKSVNGRFCVYCCCC